MKHTQVRSALDVNFDLWNHRNLTLFTGYWFLNKLQICAQRHQGCSLLSSTLRERAHRSICLLYVSLHVTFFVFLLVTLLDTAFCHAVLRGCSLLLFLPVALYPPSSLPFLPSSILPLIICYATLALQGRSHWSPFLSSPVLICYAAASPLYTSHWSTSAEFSITFSFLPSFLFTPSLFCLISYFHCQRFVSPCCMLLRCFFIYGASAENTKSVQYQEAVSEANSFRFVHISVQGGLFSPCCTHSVGIAISVCH